MAAAELHNYTAILEAPESPVDPEPVLQRVHSNFAISMQILESKLHLALNKRWAGECLALHVLALARSVPGHVERHCHSPRH